MRHPLFFDDEGFAGYPSCSCAGIMVTSTHAARGGRWFLSDLDTGNPMKHFFVPAPLAMTLGLCLAGLTGCGGGSSITLAPPSITSFTASPTTITAGSSATLTGVFTNGTGVITPGNLPATSGVAVTVSPTATTTYTLTVTPTSGTAVTATATITVNPAPTITSFTASPTTITAGSSAALTGVFANGTGVITPGNLPATSGVAVTVSPTTTTTYTLTVTPASGTAVTATATVTVTATAATSVTVDLASSGPAVTDQLLGMNLAVWYDLADQPDPNCGCFPGRRHHQVRWPGGSDSDLYHWSTNTLCDGGYADANDTFSNFVTDIAVPAKLDVALTADYGSNATCNGGGDPSEAAAWAAALADGVTVSHMTVGNEEYGSWEYDLHSTPHDPTTYAAAVVGATGYYQSSRPPAPTRWSASLWTRTTRPADGTTPCWPTPRRMTSWNTTTIRKRRARKATPSWCSRRRRS